MAWLVRTFTSDSGAKPVESWIESLDPDGRAEVLVLIDLLESLGVGLGEPFAKHLGDGIWELRARGSHGVYRVLYFHWFRHTFGLLHGFTKKTRRTPPNEFETAKRRRAAWLGRPGPGG